MAFERSPQFHLVKRHVSLDEGVGSDTKENNLVLL